MAFRMLNIAAGITCGLLFTTSVMSQSRVGNWEFRVEGEGTDSEIRIASTPAQARSGSDPGPRLVIRREKPGSPVELLVIDTHDSEKDNCVYKDWKVVIDTAEVPVLGYSFEPTKTELKAKLGTPGDELWNLFRRGLKFTVEVEQKCDSSSGESNLASYGFSLRGSNAAYRLVMGGAE